MGTQKYHHFLAECIVHDPDRQQGLCDDEMYGVYLSWCFLRQEQPGSEDAFWEAMEGLGFTRTSRSDGRYVCPGLGMTGPAALDYILSSQPSLV